MQCAKCGGEHEYGKSVNAEEDLQQEACEVQKIKTAQNFT